VSARAFAARPINEDSAHGFRGGRKEMSPAFETGILSTGEANPCFVNEGGGLQGLARHFTCHLGGGEPPQFSVNQRQQLVRGLAVTLLDRREHLREIVNRKGSCVELNRLGAYVPSPNPIPVLKIGAGLPLVVLFVPTDRIEQELAI